MRAEELMIGDWVVQDDNLCNERLCKVTGIFEHYLVEVTGEKLPLHESHIKPIPLTKDILEANGFCLFDDAFWWYKDFRITLSSSKAFTLVCGRTISFKYVHELQHAMRLCGIDKVFSLNK